MSSTSLSANKALWMARGGYSLASVLFKKSATWVKALQVRFELFKLRTGSSGVPAFFIVSTANPSRSSCGLAWQLLAGNSTRNDVKGLNYYTRWTTSAKGGPSWSESASLSQIQTANALLIGHSHRLSHRHFALGLKSNHEAWHWPSPAFKPDHTHGQTWQLVHSCFFHDCPHVLSNVANRAGPHNKEKKLTLTKPSQP